MSHGLVHNATGVKGTYLRGTVPPKAVLGAIPDTVGAVGHLAETVPPGQGGAPVRSPAQIAFDQDKQRGGLMMDGEGDFVLPGGNRADQAFMTTRPESAPITEAEEAPAEEPPEPPEAVFAESEDLAPDEAPESVTEAPEEPEAPAAPATEWPQEPEAIAEWFTKRKLVRAKVGELRAWVDVLGIEITDYEGGETPTANLMRAVIVHRIEKQFGVVIKL